MAHEQLEEARIDRATVRTQDGGHCGRHDQREHLKECNLIHESRRQVRQLFEGAVCVRAHLVEEHLAQVGDRSTMELLRKVEAA